MAFGNFTQGVTKNAGTVASSTLAFGSNVTAGRTLVVCVRQGGTGGNAITISDNLNGTWPSASSKVREDVVTGAGVIATWFFPNSAGGACTITVAFATSQTMRWAQSEYEGVFGLDTHGFGQASSTTPSATTGASTTHPTINLGHMIGGNNVAGPDDISAGTGYTKRLDLLSSPANNTFVGTEDSGTTLLTSGSAQTAAFSWPTADNWGCHVISFFDNGTTAPTPIGRPIIIEAASLDMAYTI